ncbi:MULTISPECIES: hypothetical protein [Deinococcus]|uniref:Orotate phosphoribosyltransferase related protein n=1 Tax=Deinococcus geothermalis (strain DSM 11300 / CIP 105573 / AG-3a) TaxID=319795 RepID=Q1IXX8_DEIGD|nr:MULTISPECIES: hypothetical protein [Deinococcus]ABF45906.1 Orotate phosphoribosyltransferase related protein [Deinococcus geothermalis DSM 11300]TDE86073.1 hypothetical protein E0686_08540 [Deinococcus sp. S9]
MHRAFRDAVAELLPSEARLRTWLAALSEREWEELAGLFAASLPELDGVLALPGGEHFAQALARARGIPVLDSGLHGAADLFPGEIALVTAQLQDGLPELEALLRAERRGLRVLAVVAAIERSDAPGRTRLELQDLRVWSAVRLADTPEGLAFERRSPRPWSWPKVS